MIIMMISVIFAATTRTVVLIIITVIIMIIVAIVDVVAVISFIVRNYTLIIHCSITLARCCLRTYARIFHVFPFDRFSLSHYPTHSFSHAHTHKHTHACIHAFTVVLSHRPHVSLVSPLIKSLL